MYNASYVGIYRGQNLFCMTNFDMFVDIVESFICHFTMLNYGLSSLYCIVPAMCVVK